MMLAKRSFAFGLLCALLGAFLTIADLAERMRSERIIFELLLFAPIIIFYLMSRMRLRR